MSIYIEDTARNNLATWTTNAIQAGLAVGAVITPFTTPHDRQGHKQAGATTVGRMPDGAAMWFDATTHALQMAGVGDYRFYDGWNLWEGARGALNTDDEQRDHLRRVFATQSALGTPALAPTILLHSPQSDTSQRALSISRFAVDIDPACHLSISGTSSFWASGAELDAHIGALAQLDPSGWFISAVYASTDLPVNAQPAEIAGIARTVRALSAYAPVHVSYGDLAALPAVAAGATSIGTGWDLRQKVCAFPNFYQRDSEPSTGGSWPRRPTIERLVSIFDRTEAERLQAQDRPLADSLIRGPLSPHEGGEAFTHHLRCLNNLVNDIEAGATHEERYHVLRQIYEQAIDIYPTVRGLCSCRATAGEWVTPFLAGLNLYARSEGWN